MHAAAAAVETVLYVLPFAVVLAASAAFLARETDPAARRRFLKVVLACAALMLGGLALLGIPGALLVAAASWPVERLRALTGAEAAPMADAGWPAAILLTLAWPPSVIVAYAVAFGMLRPTDRAARVAALVLLPYAAAVALTYWATTR